MSKKAVKAVEKPGVDRPITLADIESGLRTLKTDLTTVKNSAAGAGIAAGIVGAIALVILAFVIGRARGNKKFAFVEIRRA